MNTKELKAGAIFSYLLIIANTLYALIFTPFLISALGDGEYGVYKIIGSLTSSITILDLGIGSTMLRYIAKFRAEKDEKNLRQKMPKIRGFSSALFFAQKIFAKFV